MQTFELPDAGAGGPRRAHPWTTTVANPTHRYVDLCAMPELTSAVLEDFRPWDHEPAIQAFYRLVQAINGPASTLESNDCSFTGPEANLEGNAALGVTKHLQCSGRLGVLFRDLRRNTTAGATAALCHALHGQLAASTQGFDGGAVGTSRLDVDYRTLPAGQRVGSQTLIWFWAWGDDPREVFNNLDRVFAALSDALARA